MTGMRDTAKQDNMIGLCLFLSSMADSKSAYTMTGAGISHRWLVNLYFVIMNGVARSEEVVTEPALRVSCEMIFLCITLTKDVMFETAQIF